MDTVGKTFIRRGAVTDKYTWSANLLDVQEDNTLSFKVRLIWDKEEGWIW